MTRSYGKLLTKKWNEKEAKLYHGCALRLIVQLYHFFCRQYTITILTKTHCSCAYIRDVCAVEFKYEESGKQTFSKIQIRLKIG